MHSCAQQNPRRRPAAPARSTESASMDKFEQRPAQPIAKPTATPQLPSIAVSSAITRASLPRLRPNTNPLAESRDIHPVAPSQSSESASMDKFKHHPAPILTITTVSHQ